VLILLSTFCLLCYCVQFTLITSWFLRILKLRYFPKSEMKRIPSADRTFMLNDTDARLSIELSPEYPTIDERNRSPSITSSVKISRTDLPSPMPPIPIEACESRSSETINSLLPTEPED
jgi:hypothetical protein